MSELALPPTARELGLGLLLGFGLYSVCMVILMARGTTASMACNDWHILLTGMSIALATGVFEELLFRGGVFRLAEEWFGTWAALLISCWCSASRTCDAEGATLQG